MLFLSAASFLSSLVFARASTSCCSEWVKVGPAPLDAPFTLSIGLHPAGLDQIKQILLDSSISGQQQHLSHENVLALLEPSQNTSQAVHNWLTSHNVNITSLTWSTAKDWATWDTTVGSVSDLLNTTFSTFRHRTCHTEVIRAPSYEIPVGLARYIKMVHPTRMFPTFPLANSGPPIPRHNITTERRDVAAVCSGASVSLACLQQLYNIKYEITDFSAPGNGYGVVGFDGDFSNMCVWIVGNFAAWYWFLLFLLVRIFVNS